MTPIAQALSKPSTNRRHPFEVAPRQDPLGTASEEPCDRLSFVCKSDPASRHGREIDESALVKGAFRGASYGSCLLGGWVGAAEWGLTFEKKTREHGELRHITTNSTSKQTRYILIKQQVMTTK